MKSSLLALICFLLGIMQRTDYRPPDPAAQAASRSKGRAEADEELRSNQAKIWTFGLMMGDPINRETGLYYSGFGCSVDEDIIAQVEGHNDRVEEWIRQHGLPKNSFKPWEQELFGLKSYLEDRQRAGKLIRLTVGGPALLSPDGKSSIKLLQHPPEDPRATQSNRSYLEVRGSGATAHRVPVNQPNVDLAWGPQGSWFIMYKSTGILDKTTAYIAYDLRDGRTIRLEYQQERPLASEQR